ncbi:putative copper chaperone SCO1/SenC, Thioredoxin-like superfamily [Helianthus annuus]|nr:putative copper chaperone SCO1/SenC, Thioredoxin-like superfamily [Helianthus annuus]
MSVSNFIRKKSAEALFSPTRCGTQKMMFHSSSYMRAAQRSNKNGRLLDKGREQLTSSSSWRSYLLPIGVFGVLGGIGGGYLFMRSYDEKRTPRRGEGRNDGRSARNAPVIGGPFSLIGSDGRLVTEKDLQGGDWILIYFGYTASPDVGPAELAKLAKVINTLDSEHNITIRPVFVTIDPQRDTPSHLRAYLKEFDERIMGLTGPVGAIRQMANEYRVPFKKVEEDGDDYLVETSHGMYLMNPSMEFVKSFGLRYTANQLSQEIQKEVQKTQN